MPSIPPIIDRLVDEGYAADAEATEAEYPSIGSDLPSIAGLGQPKPGDVSPGIPPIIDRLVDEGYAADAFDAEEPALTAPLVNPYYQDMPRRFLQAQAEIAQIKQFSPQQMQNINWNEAVARHEAQKISGYEAMSPDEKRRLLDASREAFGAETSQMFSERLKREADEAETSIPRHVSHVIIRGLGDFSLGLAADAGDFMHLISQGKRPKAETLRHMVEDWLDTHAPLKPSEAENLWLTDVPGGATSMALFILGSWRSSVTRALGIGGLMGIDEGYVKSLQKKDITTLQTVMLIAGHGALGTTDGLPLLGFLRRFDKKTGGKATEYLVNRLMIRNPLVNKAAKLGEASVAQVWKEASQEFGQEFGATLWDYFISVDDYESPKDAVWEALRRGGRGAAVGAILGGTMGFAGGIASQRGQISQEAHERLMAVPIEQRAGREELDLKDLRDPADWAVEEEAKEVSPEEGVPEEAEGIVDLSYPEESAQPSEGDVPAARVGRAADRPAKEPWQMTKEEYRSSIEDPGPIASAVIVENVGSAEPGKILRHYQDKYPELKGVTLGGLSSTKESGPLDNHGVARVVFQDGKFVPSESQIHLTKNVTPDVVRHEIEHLLDVIHGAKLDPAKPSFTRFSHDDFAADYAHRSSIKKAVTEGKTIPAEVLKDYPDLPTPSEGAVPAPTTPVAEDAPKVTPADPEAEADVTAPTVEGVVNLSYPEKTEPSLSEADERQTGELTASEVEAMAPEDRIDYYAQQVAQEQIPVAEAADEMAESVPEGESHPNEPSPVPAGLVYRDDIGPDLMEAARILESSARSKELLGHMLGVFSHSPKKTLIALGDIRWIRTFAHEVGHAVDFVLHGKTFPSSINKRFGNLKEKAARNELKAVSEYMRPLGELKWNDKSSHMKYRARHQELMADMIGLYLLDRRKALQLAPNLTAELELAIAKNTQVQEAVNLILRPEQAQAPKVPLAEQGTTLTEDEGVSEPYTHPDPSARKSAFEIAKKASREVQSQVERIYAVSRKWRESISERQRELITFAIEGTGDPRIKGDTVTEVLKRMTPATRKVMREVRYELELARQEANKLFREAGVGNEAIKYLEDYIPHIYQISKRKAREFASRWNKRTPHKKHRTLPTLKEAVAHGLRPISYDAAYLHERAAEQNFKAAATNLMVKELKDLRTTEGAKVISSKQINSDWVKIEHPVLRQFFAYKDAKGKTVLGKGEAYVHPSIARPVQTILDRPFSGNFARAWHGLNSAAKGINVAFSLFHEVTLFESSTAANMKFLNPLRGVIIGPFEAKKLGLKFRPYLTHRAGLLLGKGDVFGAEDAARHGLALRQKASSDYARGWMESHLRKMENLTQKIPGLNWATKAIRKGYESYQRHMWDNVHQGLKLFTYHRIVEESLLNQKILESNGGNVKAIKQFVASGVNDMFGGQEFLELPTIQKGHLSLSEPATIKQVQIMEGMMFAPDWTMSNIRVAGRTVTQIRSPLARKMFLTYWRNMAIGFAGSTTAATMSVFALFGDDDPDLKQFPWQMEPGREWDVDVTPIMRSVQKAFGAEPQKHRSYVHTGKQWREVIRYFSDFPKGLLTNIGNKSSVGVRMSVQQVVGHQIGSAFPMPWVGTSYRDELLGIERIFAQAKAAGEHFIPFSWQPNNFAFALPRRKGMTRYRAIRHYGEAFRAYADPGFWDDIRVPGEDTKRVAVENVIREVDDALRANGFSEKKREVTFSLARTKIRSQYYGKLWEAIEDEKFREAQKWSQVLSSLGVNRRGVVGSAKSREITRAHVSKALKLFERGKRLEYNRIIK
mgnify:CR=1 FL=1